MKRLVPVSILVFLAPTLFAAERIILRDGTTIDGTLRTQNRTIVVVDTKNGRQTIPKANITRIVFGLPDPEEIEKKKAEEAKARAKEREAQERARLERESADQQSAAEAQVARAEKWEKKLQDDAAQRAAQEAALKQADGAGKTSDTVPGEKSSRTTETKDTAQTDKDTSATANNTDTSGKSRNAAIDTVSKDTEQKPDTTQQPARDTAMNDNRGARDQERPMEQPGLSPGSAALYSAFLPGLGQMRTGRTMTGSLYMTLFLGSLYGAYNENRLYMQARKDYEQYNNPYNQTTIEFAALGITLQTNPYADNTYLTAQTYNQKRGNVEKFFRARNQLAGFAGLVYGFAIIDALLFTSSTGRTALNNTPAAGSYSFFVAPAPPVFVATQKWDRGLTAGLTTVF
ncbi:MAG: hypothetical protein HY042_08320 [Spirochaetia bacterium]|nr:hypothetical protein [Spirochaetia bacterium]